MNRPSCPDASPETGWLTRAADGTLRIEPFYSFTNDAEGRAYARKHHLDYPFPGDTYDASIGSPHPLALSPGTVCTGVIQVGYRDPLEDHRVRCTAFSSALREGPVTSIRVAVWCEHGRVVQLSELYRP